LYILIVRSSLGPSPPNAGRYTVASRFRCRSCERGYIFPRAPEQFVASPLCLVGYVRWDARSDRVPPLRTIIFSSFPGRTKGCRRCAMSKGSFSGGPKAVFMTGIRAACVLARSAYPNSVITFGFGTNLPFSVRATKVTSGIKMSEFAIFSRMVAVIGDVPGTPWVSESICSSTSRVRSSVIRAFLEAVSLRDENREQTILTKSRELVTVS
jgi:hypothetical protein